MASEPPDRFGPYEVIGLLGAGGMGQVYRARDPRLKRDVAIKVLVRAGADPVRQRQFIDEAQAASALNHPNIVAVYDVGTHDGTPYIVSELVDGTSLRELILRAPLATREVLDLGAQMADGLAAAHQAGIVHRDFKPENVMVTREGRVKIVDFGLALVGTGDELSAADVTVTLAAGTIVGTVPYMSPEQARGATVDYRTDQFSLGLTLYEMVTGRRAFRAETAAQTLAAILDDEPEPIGTINPRVPAPVRWAIERCLAKDARQRYESTTDLARELRTLRDRIAEFAPAPVVSSPPRRRAWVMLVAAPVVAAIAVLAGLAGRATETGLDRYRWTPFATDAGYQGAPSWSPDGRTLAYIADVDGIEQLFTRALASPTRQQVTHARFDCRDPFWSSDGTRLFYISLAHENDSLWSISPAGGEPELVLENVSRAALSPDGKTLAFFPGDGAGGLLNLRFSSPPGAPPESYTRPPFGTQPRYSQATMHFSPDGSKLGVWVVASLQFTNNEGSEFWVLPLGNGAQHLAPPPVAEFSGLAGAFSWLPDSRHVLSALPWPKPGMHMWAMDTERADSRLLTTTGGLENDPAVSPDGKRLALALQQADYDVYQISIEHPSPSAVLTTSRNEMDPTWSSSAAAMAFTTDRSGREEIWLRSQRGDWEKPLVRPTDFGASQTNMLSSPSISTDGQRVAYYRLGGDGARIWITSVAGGPPIPLAENVKAQDSPSWSPDGSWIAYSQGPSAATAAGAGWKLAKMRVGARTPPEVITPDIDPSSPVQWSPDGAWIAFNGRGGLSIVSPDGKSMRVLYEVAWMAFAWSQDSQRLFGLRQSDDIKHLTFTSVDLRSGAEHVLGADVMPLPIAAQPVRGFTRVSATTFLTSIARVRSDIWLLEGFEPPPTLWDLLTSVLRR